MNIDSVLCCVYEYLFSVFICPSDLVEQSSLGCWLLHHLWGGEPPGGPLQRAPQLWRPSHSVGSHRLPGLHQKDRADRLYRRCVCEREIKSVCVYVCMRERVREREKKSNKESGCEREREKEKSVCLCRAQVIFTRSDQEAVFLWLNVQISHIRPNTLYS